jgi:ribulose bisphosphate carboxylase small subunit
MTDAPDWLPEFVTENLRTILLGVAGYIAYVEYTGASYPETPQWVPLLGFGALVAVFTAFVAAGRFEDLFPEEHGVYLQVVNARKTDVIETWELTEDEWEEIEVVGGRLNHLPNCKHRAYECIAYNPDSNVAVASWRKSKPASEIVGHHEIGDALDEMEEIRSDLEPEARFSSMLRRRLPSIIRTLDRQRAMDQNRALEGHMTPDLGGDSVDDVLRDTLDDEFLPPRLKNDEDDEGEVADDRAPAAKARDGLTLLQSLGESTATNGDSDRDVVAPGGEGDEQ